MKFFISATRGGSTEDRTTFVSLLRDLKAAFEPHSLELSVALAADSHTIDRAYDLPSIYKYVDLASIMTYDFSSYNQGIIGTNAPLNTSREELADPWIQTVERSLKHLIKKGAIPEKTALGVPFYGRSFLATDPSEAKIGGYCQTKTAPAGPITRARGQLGYMEICRIQPRYNNWTLSWDDDRKVPYMVSGDKFISYDNVKSIKLKTEFALREKLAGVMIWAIDTDDFMGE